MWDVFFVFWTAVSFFKFVMGDCSLNRLMPFFFDVVKCVLGTAFWFLVWGFYFSFFMLRLLPHLPQLQFCHVVLMFDFLAL